MTLQWIPLGQLEPHPENSNRLGAGMMEKLKRHIERTGLYEPLVVRPVGGGEQGKRDAPLNAAGQEKGRAKEEVRPAGEKYQLLNGHHRAEVLRQLGHTHARCDVWEVDDGEARMLLATLNRLEGRDDARARGELLKKLSESRPPEELSRLLPEPPDAVERLMKLASPPPMPTEAGRMESRPRPMTFFLSEEQYGTVREALRRCAEGERRLTRNEALERMAAEYVEKRR